MTSLAPVFMLIAEMCKLSSGESGVIYVQKYQGNCQTKYINCLMDKGYFSDPSDIKVAGCVLRVNRSINE